MRGEAGLGRRGGRVGPAWAARKERKQAGRRKKKEEEAGPGCWVGLKREREKERVLHFSKRFKQIQFEFKFKELKFKLNNKQ